MQEYLGGEVVGVSSDVAACGERALGISLTVAFVVFEEVEVKHFGFVERPLGVGDVDEVARYYYLVEEVPLAFVCECAYAERRFIYRTIGE